MERPSRSPIVIMQSGCCEEKSYIISGYSDGFKYTQWTHCYSLIYLLYYAILVLVNKTNSKKVNFFFNIFRTNQYGIRETEGRRVAKYAICKMTRKDVLI